MNGIDECITIKAEGWKCCKTQSNQQKARKP